MGRALKFRYPLLKQQTLTIALLDTSSSTLGGSGLSQAKGVLKQLAIECYVKRQQLCIMTFGNNRIQTVLKVQRAPKNIERTLNKITGGGGTPLRKALTEARDFILRQHKHYPLQEHRLFIFTDGRSKEEMQDIEFTETALTIIDTECGAVKLGHSKNLATHLGANYMHLQSLPQV